MSKTVLTMLNMAVLAPMPRPRVMIASKVNPGLRSSERKAKRRLEDIRDLLLDRAVVSVSGDRMGSAFLAHA